MRQIKLGGECLVPAIIKIILHREMEMLIVISSQTTDTLGTRDGIVLSRYMVRDKVHDNFHS